MKPKMENHIYLIAKPILFPLYVHVKSLQLCPTLRPSGYNLPGSSVHGILQAKFLEWVAIAPSRGSSRPRDQAHVSCSSCTAGGFFTTEPPGKPSLSINSVLNNWSLSMLGRPLLSAMRIGISNTDENPVSLVMDTD